MENEIQNMHERPHGSRIEIFAIELITLRNERDEHFEIYFDEVIRCCENGPEAVSSEHKHVYRGWEQEDFMKLRNAVLSSTDHSDFIAALALESGYVHVSRHLIDRLMTSWLQRNVWVTDENSPCHRCTLKEKKGWFSEKKCTENVSQGGSCYRKTLSDTFIPFLQKVLATDYPPTSELMKQVHTAGPVHDGVGNSNLMGIVSHELGGMREILQVEYIRVMGEKDIPKDDADA